MSKPTVAWLARIALAILLAFLAEVRRAEAAESAQTATTTMVAEDEHVVFFRTAGWLGPNGETWHLPIHGWVYEPQDSTVRKAAIATVLREMHGLKASRETRANFDRRVNLLLADNERGKRIVVRIGARLHALPKSDPSGHFSGVVEVPRAEVAQLADGGVVTFEAVTMGGESRQFAGEVQLVSPTGLSVVSDIDDTIKVTEVTDRATMFDRTFFRDFEPVPGMPALYADWASRGLAFHFVSSSPWQLYSSLEAFTVDAGFPWASFSLKSVRFRDATLLDLFKKGTETKPEQIEVLLERFPRRRFILVGDDGEQDPEVYADLYRAHPEQVERIYIRNVTGAARDDARFAAVFRGVPAGRWELFTAPSTLASIR